MIKEDIAIDKRKHSNAKCVCTTETATKHVKQRPTELKEEVDKSIIIHGVSL